MDKLHGRPKNQQTMDSNSVVFKQPSETPKLAMKKDVFAPPSLQSSLEAFSVPLPPDLENEDILMSENTTERKPDYEQKELKKQYYGEQDKVRQISEEGIDPPHSYSCVSLCAPKCIPLSLWAICKIC